MVVLPPNNARNCWPHDVKVQRIKYCGHEWWSKAWWKQESTPQKFNINTESDSLFEVWRCIFQGPSFCLCVNTYGSRITFHSPKNGSLATTSSLTTSPSMWVFAGCIYLIFCFLRLNPESCDWAKTNQNYYQDCCHYPPPPPQQQQKKNRGATTTTNKQNKGSDHNNNNNSHISIRCCLLWKKIWPKQRLIWPKLSRSNAIGPCEALLNTSTTSLVNLLHFLLLQLAGWEIFGFPQIPRKRFCGIPELQYIYTCNKRGWPVACTVPHHMVFFVEF